MHRLDDHYYPVTETLSSGYLPVGEGHELYWEVSGNLAGVPFVFVHGGPGGSNSPNYRRFMDPEKYRIIQFDQRGCGKSQYNNRLGANTLQHTITDMEKLRGHLEIDKWIVAGGSWGSTVSLAYAEAHPDKCLGLLLVSMWLNRKKEIDWWYQGVRTIFPELWEQFASLVPENERDDLCTAYSKRILHGNNKQLAEKLATQLYLYEEGFMRFDVPISPPELANAVNYGQIFSYYSSNGFFLKYNQLLRDSYKIKDLPVVLVTGRYDICTTPDNAYDLNQKLSNSELIIVSGAGHYPTELPLSRACLDASERLFRKVSKTIKRNK